ncbi:MAG: GNAT family N-acetyltransferase [Flavobacteriales bacterium]|nr:GNAT family N-acetyltransferase [Flavobacteriales bacterium]
MSNQIHVASLKDLNSVCTIFKQCAEFMREQGIYQWDANYPNTNEIRENITQSEVWIFKIGHTIVGTITLNEFQSPEYMEIPWRHHSFLVVHRLAVLPTSQGKGIARILMDHAEQLCISNGKKSIRLDTYSLNPRNLKFYTNRNYQHLGNVHFREMSAPFLCLEKLLE